MKEIIKAIEAERDKSKKNLDSAIDQKAQFAINFFLGNHESYEKCLEIIEKLK